MDPAENQDQPGATPADATPPIDATPADVGTGGEDQFGSGAPAEGSSEYEKLLSSLTEGGLPPATPAGQPRDASGRFAPRQLSDQPPDQPVTSVQPAAPSQPATPGATQSNQPPAQPNAPKTPEQEEAELLAGIQSERGRDRVRQIIEARKQAESSVAAIRDTVAAAGMTAETFGQHIEFARLLHSADPRDLQSAAQMLETVRADLYRRLGQDAPALDVLTAYPDLAQRVAALEIPREVALEVARMRRQSEQDEQSRQAQVQRQQRTDQFQHDIAAAQQSLEAYVATREHEVDHPARMQALQTYFADPKNLQNFASTYQPNQWPAAIRMLYDNIRVAAQPRNPAPISSRSALPGRPAVSANAPGEEQIMGMIEGMGLI